MGQETIYLILTIAVFVAVALAVYIIHQHKPADSKQVEDPPIITLSEADGYYFQPGSPLVSQPFAEQLRSKIAPKLKQIAQDYNATIVEVIGHTDEVPFGRARRQLSDLDATLIDWYNSRIERVPVPFDNFGLGMARAVAVARALKASGLGDEFSIIPLSAGPFLKLDDTVTDGRDATAAENRRRIEIRLRRKTKR